MNILASLLSRRIYGARAHRETRNDRANGRNCILLPNPRHNHSQLRLDLPGSECNGRGRELLDLNSCQALARSR